MIPKKIHCSALLILLAFVSCSPKITTKDWIMIDSYTFNANDHYHSIGLRTRQKAVKFQALDETVRFDSIVFIHPDGSRSNRMAGESIPAGQYSEPVSFPALLGKIKSIEIYVHYRSFPGNLILQNHPATLKTFIPAD